jgi:TatD DNase family protein
VTGLGFHPQLAHERRNELPLFDSFLPMTRFVGEVGLDGSPELRTHWNSQIAVFEHVLEKCQAAGGKIISLHSRRATGEVLDYLTTFSGAGSLILHWFSGTLRDLDRAIDLGCWFSIGPAMLASKTGINLARCMPHGRVLTESDGPFARVNDKTLMPWDVEKAIYTLSEIWSMTPQAVEQLVEANLRNLLLTAGPVSSAEIK